MNIQQQLQQDRSVLNSEKSNAKITASSLIFKQLVDSLRRKKHQNHYQTQNHSIFHSNLNSLQNQNSQSILQVNPDYVSKQKQKQKVNKPASLYNQSVYAQNIFSQKNSYEIQQNQIKNNLSMFNHPSYTQKITANMNYNQIKKQLDNDEEAIRLKPKGSVNGRDVIKKKQIDKDSFQHKVHYFQDTMKNKLIRVPRSINNQVKNINKSNLTVKQYYQKQQEDQKDNNYQKSHARTSRNFSEINLPLNQKAKKKNQIQQVSSNFSLPNTFTQNKFNKAIVQVKKFRDFDQKVIIKFCQQNNKLNENSQAKQIFAFFSKLCQEIGAFIYNPAIKKYKNCVYYGNQMRVNESYEGFLYFFDSRFYFGDLIRGHKDGNGVQVNLKDKSIWRGQYQDGQKTGKFQVIKLDQSYLGDIVNGLYHGKGKLVTKQSVYEGAFQKGYKHGYGQQVFPKTGLKLKGNFYHGIFQAQQARNQMSQSRNYFSKPEISNPEKIQSNNYPYKQQYDLPQPMFLPRNTSLGFHKQKKSYENSNSYYDQYAPYSQNNKSMRSSFSKNKLTDTRKKLFNQQKLLRMNPSSRDRLPQNIIKKSSNLMEFDYSFDAANSQITNTISSNGGFNPFGTDFKNSNNYEISRFKGIRFKQRIQTNQLQQPLPVPCFYKGN